MKLVPDTNGTLFKSSIRSNRSKRTLRDLEAKAPDMPVRECGGVAAPLGVSDSARGDSAAAL